MNKKQPFEEAFDRQMNNLPSPNEDESWQKMKQLLDDNDKRKPFVFYKTYKTAIVLLFMLLIGCWLLIHKTDITKEKPVAFTKNNRILQQKAQTKPKSQPTDLQRKTYSDHSLIFKNTNQKHSDQQTPLVSAGNKILLLKSADVNSTAEVNQPANSFFKKTNINQNDTLFRNHNNATKTGNDDIRNKISNPSNNSAGSSGLSDSQKNSRPDTFTNIQKINPGHLTFPLQDTSPRKEDSLLQNADLTEVVPFNNKKYFLSAGIGVQQQVPLAGQKVVSYGYDAKNTLSDYIPSVYLRLQRDRKWYLQAEFVYMAPQLIRQFSYRRQTLASDSNRTITTTELNLKKTFFNKIPVTFNYYIRPNWSAGVGGMYSMFEGAIAEKEITTKSTQSQVESVVKQIVPIEGYTDSFLYKSSMYLVAQANYDRPRFSVGLRYAKGVQPYIKYTLPDGTVTSKKNWALEFLVRVRLWKSAKF